MCFFGNVLDEFNENMFFVYKFFDVEQSGKFFVIFLLGGYLMCMFYYFCFVCFEVSFDVVIMFGFIWLRYYCVDVFVQNIDFFVFKCFLCLFGEI